MRSPLRWRTELRADGVWEPLAPRLAGLLPALVMGASLVLSTPATAGCSALPRPFWLWGCGPLAFSAGGCKTGSCLASASAGPTAHVRSSPGGSAFPWRPLNG